MNRHYMLCGVATLLSVLLASSCAYSDADEVAEGADEPAAVQSALATAAGGTLIEFESNGSKFSFVELSPGSVIIYAETRDGAINPLEKLKGIGFLETYKHLTGKTPPEALIAADERRQAIEREPLTPEELAESKQQALEPEILAMEASEFQTKVCNGRKVCEVNQSANREWGEVRADTANGYVNLVAGPAVALQVRDRRVRGWSNDQYKQVVFNSNLFWTWQSPRRSVAFRLKVAVYEVDPGDIYHFTMAW